MKDIRILYVEDDLEFGRLTKILLDQEEFYGCKVRSKSFALNFI